MAAREITYESNSEKTAVHGHDLRVHHKAPDHVRGSSRDRKPFSTAIQHCGQSRCWKLCRLPCSRRRWFHHQHHQHDRHVLYRYLCWCRRRHQPLLWGPRRRKASHCRGDHDGSDLHLWDHFYRSWNLCCPLYVKIYVHAG